LSCSGCARAERRHETATLLQSHIRNFDFGGCHNRAKRVFPGERLTRQTNLKKYQELEH